MKRAMNKSLGDYIQANGWSSSQFFEQAKVLLTDRDLQSLGEFEIGRTVVHYRANRFLKFYVHHNGRTKDYLTIIDGNTGVELETFHHTTKAEEIKKSVLRLLTD